ncbi:MAG: hypothetical protein PHE36_01595 [Novosphingobium sp.]|nr:hypothetical protein [Novosphingobium sp.]
MPKTIKDKGKTRPVTSPGTPPAPDVPGAPTPDAAINLLIADIAMRGGTYLTRLAVEKALLRSRYDPRAAKKALAGQTLGKRLLSLGASRLAARSVPGALVVGGGLLAKAMLDRARKRRKAAQESPATAGETAPGKTEA